MCTNDFNRSLLLLLGILFFIFYFLVRKNSIYRDSNSRPNVSEGYEGTGFDCTCTQYGCFLGVMDCCQSENRPPSKNYFFLFDNQSNEETFRKNFLAQNFLRKKKLEYSQPRKFSSPKFPGDKRKFYEEILGSLDNRTGISTPSQYWMMPTAACCTCTRLCSLLYSHMHRVTQTLPQEP